MAIRALVSDASKAWKNLDTVGGVVIDVAYKATYEALAAPLQISGFALYMKETIALNWIANDYSGTLAITDINPA